jgi:hypothetical protein
MFFRIKTAGSHQYLQIIHSVREGKKVRQQAISPERLGACGAERQIGPQSYEPVRETRRAKNHNLLSLDQVIHVPRLKYGRWVIRQAGKWGGGRKSGGSTTERLGPLRLFLY